MADRSKSYLSIPALVAFTVFGALFWWAALVDPGNWSRWLFTGGYTVLLISLFVRARSHRIKTK